MKSAKILAATFFSLALLTYSVPAQVGGTPAATNAAPPAAPPPKVVVKPDHANGVYGLNEKVTWTVDAIGDRTALKALPYSVKQNGGTEIAKGTVDLSSGPATITASLGVPGTLLVEPIPAAGGAGVSSGHSGRRGRCARPESLLPRRRPLISMLFGRPSSRNSMPCRSTPKSKRWT